METPWQRSRKTKSERQELRLTKLTGGRKQVNSGRGPWWSKRDGRIGRFANWLVEARTTDKGSYSISRKEFEKIREEAIGTPPSCLAAMVIDIQGLSLLVIQTMDFDDMQKYIMELENKLDAKRTQQKH